MARIEGRTLVQLAAAQPNREDLPASDMSDSCAICDIVEEGPGGEPRQVAGRGAGPQERAAGL